MDRRIDFNQQMMLFVSGTMAGIASLIFSSMFYFFIIQNSIGSMVLVALIEETIKLAFLWLVVDLLEIDFARLKKGKIFSLAVLFGIGFGLFEWLLYFLSGNNLFVMSFFPLVVHIVSVWVLMIGMKIFFKNKTFFSVASFWVLAVSFHAFYNLIMYAIDL